MEQKSFCSGIKVQSPPKSITAVPAIPAVLEYSSSSTHSQKMLHSIYCSSHLIMTGIMTGIMTRLCGPIFVPVSIKTFN